MFQRGSGRWGKEQEMTFIDSLIKGYPVGTMLFYKTVEDNQEIYILVDGLQEFVRTPYVRLPLLYCY